MSLWLWDKKLRIKTKDFEYCSHKRKYLRRRNVLTFVRKMCKVSRKSINWIGKRINVQVKKTARFGPWAHQEAEGIHGSILYDNIQSDQGLFTSCSDTAVVRRDLFLREKSQAVENGSVPKSVPHSVRVLVLGGLPCWGFFFLAKLWGSGGGLLVAVGVFVLCWVVFGGVFSFQIHNKSNFWLRVCFLFAYEKM